MVLLPENLFYNTTAPGIILLLNRSKPEERKEQILLINLSQHFEKGKPKNVLTDEGIDAATEVYQEWESREKLSNVITLEDAQKTDYNLSPSQFIDVGDKIEHRNRATRRYPTRYPAFTSKCVIRLYPYVGYAAANRCISARRMSSEGSLFG